MFKKSVAVLFFTMLVITGLPAYAETTPVGMVISMYNGAWVTHEGGAKEPLTLKAPIYRGDTINTDKTGKVQVLFSDDTSLAVAPMSTVNIDDFVYNDQQKPYFAVKVFKGAGRVISGKIVEQNPLGFKLSSPHGTAGIRGTVVSVITGPKDDIYSIESIDPSHFVDISQNSNFINTTRSALEGYSIIVSDNPETQNAQRKTTEEERTLMNQVFSSKPVPEDTATNSSTQSDEDTAKTDTQETANNQSADNTENKSEEGEQTASTKDKEESSEGAVSGNVASDSVPGGEKTDNIVSTNRNPGVGDTSVNDTVKEVAKDKDTKPELPRTFNAFYHGNLNASGTNHTNFQGEFGFKVDLNTARYYDGYIHGQSKGDGVFNASGGKGTVNIDGTFSANDFNLSGTGDYATTNGASMSGNITANGTDIKDWSVTGGANGTISGTGSGTVQDNFVNNPYNDVQASFAGNFTSNGPNSADANQGFGFNIKLISGLIDNAYLYYAYSNTGGDVGALKAEGGTGRATTLTADNKYLNAFSINFSSIRAYGAMYSNYNGATASLTGNLINAEQGVTLTGGSINGNGSNIIDITGGTGNIVASLPGMQSDKTASFMAYYNNAGHDRDDLDRGDLYYEFGFNLNFLTSEITNIYLYGGLYGEQMDGTRIPDVNNNVFYTNGESGKLNGTSYNIRLSKVQYGNRYTAQGFTIRGDFREDLYAGTGQLQYVGGGLSAGFGSPVNLTRPNALNPLPFMIANYEGNINRGDINGSTGFKVNLVNGHITQGYLMLTKADGTLSASDGTGFLEADKEFEITDFASLYGTGSFLNAKIDDYSGELIGDYNSAMTDINVVSSTGSNLLNENRMPLNKVDKLSDIMAYYSTPLIYNAPAGAGYEHNGGKLGFTYNVKTGTVSNAGFILMRTSGIEHKTNGQGSMTGVNMDVKWDADSGGNKNYSAQLQGDITKATLFIREGTRELIADNTVKFSEPDKTGNKRGTVAGSLVGAGVNNSSYQFKADLYSGTISDARMNINTTSPAGSGGSIQLSGGTGHVNAGSFAIGDYQKGAASGAYTDFGSAQMDGKFNDANNSFNSIKWQTNNAAGGVIDKGSGSSGTLRP